MQEPLDEADLVVHRNRPGSYGFINKRLGDERYEVQWCAVQGPAIGELETCEGSDLVPTYCPGCGENQCWCGVGR